MFVCPYHCYGEQRFLRVTALPAGTAERVLAMTIMLVCLFVRMFVWGVTTRYRIKPMSDTDSAFSPYGSLESSI